MTIIRQLLKLWITRRCRPTTRQPHAKPELYRYEHVSLPEPTCPAQITSRHAPNPTCPAQTSCYAPSPTRAAYSSLAMVAMR